MAVMRTAAILTVGTELTTGLRQDTNSTEIARMLADAGYVVRAALALPDDRALVAEAIRSLVEAYDLVVVTGGLGPTHDDITREAASDALGRALLRNETITTQLARVVARHTQTASREQMLRQADVLDGATVLPAVAGTAPGQIVTLDDGHALILLPGPPHEMRPLLLGYLETHPRGPAPVRLRCTGITESDAQHLVVPVITDYAVELTLLAAPGDVEVVLFPRDGDPTDLEAASAAAQDALGAACYSTDGSSLAETVVRLARERGEIIATAESCTGGMFASALTDVPGASAVFTGGVVAYDNAVKTGVLGVPTETLAQSGAVSDQTARALAEGALALPGATISVATTGIAGPDGGSDEKPVGLVWFAAARTGGETRAIEHRLQGSRSAVRARATLIALDMLRRDLLER